MSNVISIISRQPIYQAETENANHNQTMHLRAHGWNSWHHINGVDYWYHQDVMSGTVLDFNDAWQAQKAIELARRYRKS